MAGFEVTIEAEYADVSRIHKELSVTERADLRAQRRWEPLKLQSS